MEMVQLSAQNQKHLLYHIMNTGNFQINLRVKSGNKAIASVTAKLTKNSTVYDTIHKIVTFTCSPDGTFS